MENKIKKVIYNNDTFLEKKDVNDNEFEFNILNSINDSVIVGYSRKVLLLINHDEYEDYFEHKRSKIEDEFIFKFKKILNSENYAEINSFINKLTN